MYGHGAKIAAMLADWKKEAWAEVLADADAEAEDEED